MVADERDSGVGETDFESPFQTYHESIQDSGYYYLSPTICKDIVIKAGVGCVYTPKAVKKMRNHIFHLKEDIERLIPAFRFIDRKIIHYYSSELAECLVEAADVGKGVDIAIGFPKILVFKVS